MGQQVANNRTLHHVMELFTDENGDWYLVSQPQSRPALIKGEYLPIGNKLVYPKKWGRRKAAEVLLNHLVTDTEAVISDSTTRLAKLIKVREGIPTMKDDI